MATMIHCEPKLAANSSIKSGRMTAAELIDILSAPAPNKAETSESEDIPPPTVKGIFTF